MGRHLRYLAANRLTADYVLPLASSLAASVVAIVAIQVILAVGPFSALQSTDWAATAVASALPLGLTAVLLLLERKGILPLSIGLQLVFAAGFLVVVGNIVGGFANPLPYGDTGQLGNMITDDVVFPRWFLGSAVLTRLYQSLWAPIGPHLPIGLDSAAGLVRFAGAGVMVCGSLVFLRRHGTRLALVLPLLCPVWLLFHSGYDEYYPFIAWGYLGVLFLLSDGLEKRSPRFIAVVCAALCLSYAAFVPVALFLLVCYGLSTGIRKTGVSVMMTGAICAAALVLLWPGSLRSFAHEYVRELNLGEQNTVFAAYVGKSAGSASPFFSLSYVFSLEHLSHLAFMFFFGLGPVLILSFLGLKVAALKRGLSPLIFGSLPPCA